MKRSLSILILLLAGLAPAFAQTTTYLRPVATTSLNGDLDAAATRIEVSSTAGFPSNAILQIGTEVITCTSKQQEAFLGCTRGANGTTAASYISGTTVSRLLASVPALTTDVDVRIFGAVGDDATNSTSAIQAAIDYAVANNRRTVVFPAGVFRIGKIDLSTGNYIVLRGSGRGSTILRSIDGSQPLIEITGVSAHTILIEDLTLDGAGPTSGSSNHGIHVHSNSFDTYNLTLRNVEITDCGGNGVYVQGQFTNHFDSVFISNCGGNGFDLSGGNTVLLSNCYVDDLADGKVGYRIRAGQATLLNCNGLDSLGSVSDWGVFGQTTADDGADTYADVTLINCNVEAFKRYGGWAKVGSRLSSYGSFFTTSSSGSAHVAIRVDYTNNEPGIVDAATRFNTQGTGTWANGQPIHGTDTPVIQIGHRKNPNYYNTSSASNVQLPSLAVTSLSSEPQIYVPKLATDQLKFATDNTGDIGATSASRPRDVHVGRDAYIAGLLTAGNIVSDGYILADDIYTEAYSATPSAAGSIIQRRHRGTSGSPAAVQQFDVLAYQSYQGQYDGTPGNRASGAYLTVSTSENWSATSNGTTVVLTASPNGAADPFAAGWRLDPSNLSFESKDDAELDLGRAAYRWRDLHLSRNAYIGDSLQVANSSNSNILTIKAGATSAAYDLVLPTAAGSAGDCVKNSGTPGTWTTGSCGSGASTALDNLASVAINTSLISDTDVTDDLGSSSIGWRDLYVSHVVGAGSTPSLAEGTGAGTGPSSTISGTDLVGFVSITTGSTPSSSATVFEVTTVRSFGGAGPVAVLTPANAAAAALTGTAQVYVDDASTLANKWVVKVGSTALAASTTYSWYYHVLQ